MPNSTAPPESQPPYIGAVYYRKTNPPREDWERDYRVAREDGHTLFRHWFAWNVIEVAPGRYVWEDFDRQLDLAAKYGLRTIIAEMSLDYPEWLYTQYPHARRENRHGVYAHSEMHVSCVTGGHQALCLDNDEVAEACARFLTALAQRYRDHPGLYGYDVWNECTFYHPDLLCYCPATQARFRQWLQDKYGDLARLKEMWHRYSLTSWDDVEMSRQVASYPDVYDRIAFHNDNAFRWMRWKVDVLRNADPEHLIAAHGNARSFADIAPACGDDFRAADLVDVFGYTYWHGNRCHPMLAGDLIRSASRGKRFWRAEGVGDSDWLGRDSVGRPQLVHDTMHDPANIRLDFLLSFAAGASGFLNPRWRPLLDGPLFGAFGWYGMDGRRTERSAMVTALARWTNAPEVQPLWAAQPVRGEVAILISETSQANAYARHGSADFYSACVQGAWEAFAAANIQCDFVTLPHIDACDLLYIPYPLAFTDTAVARLREWVAEGGHLVVEGCCGYFNEYGHAFPQQPNRGLAEVLGCQEHTVAFAPDLAEWFPIQTEDGIVCASLYRQSYLATTGAPIGWHANGEIAMLQNTYGRGATLIVGGMPGYAYKHFPTTESRHWYKTLLDWAHKEPWVQVEGEGILARIWRARTQTFLWALNLTMAPVQAAITVNPAIGSSPETVTPLRGSGPRLRQDGAMLLEVPALDGIVIAL
jgi:beta-galactosidase